ncbi:hypothetical protein E1264_33960 [Actinomadura sp. KC216]|uniref:hypothetical protein n=1 Tax=Actinomadura sp. KC216 TaxID=2530370 RepID=UPI00104D2D07|nr:hypothetical protein [Actinomadura sp. KC216]TDB80553.1 hypothetical protein E1264_33960 [Actinomadura sp. KC216]
MKLLPGSRRLAVITGAAVLATALSGAATASAQDPETVCGPEAELGAVVYQVCSDVVHVGETTYTTQPFLEARNRGISEVELDFIVQHWDPAASGWATDGSGSKTLHSGNTTRWFGGPNFWPCGTDAPERGRVSMDDLGDGDWADVVTPAAC